MCFLALVRGIVRKQRKKRKEMFEMAYHSLYNENYGKYARQKYLENKEIAAMNVTPFGVLPTGEQAHLYTIRCGRLEAAVTDFGAHLVRLLVPDREGTPADVVLGFDSAAEYAASESYLGATVGRSANRIGGASFVLGGNTYTLARNDHGNNLHSGPDSYNFRMWNMVEHTESSVCLKLESPNGDQGFPGKAQIRVTYALEHPGTLHITYDAVCDTDTVFNLTNHSYFNLAGHERPEKALEQVLSMSARVYTVADAESIPTGEMRSVEGTPMDFRTPKPIGRDIEADYEALNLQGGYDHNYEVFCNPCAILSDPESGRTMSVVTDCPGVQFYSGNFLTGETGKNGVVYGRRSGICLETQYYPDAINHPQWVQPVTKAGEHYHSETKYIFY